MPWAFVPDTRVIKNVSNSYAGVGLPRLQNCAYALATRIALTLLACLRRYSRDSQPQNVPFAYSSAQQILRTLNRVMPVQGLLRTLCATPGSRQPSSSLNFSPSANTPIVIRFPSNLSGCAGPLATRHGVNSDLRGVSCSLVHYPSAPPGNPLVLPVASIKLFARRYHIILCLCLSLRLR